MKNKLGLIVAFILLFTLSDKVEAWTGSGTVDDPYVIGDVNDLQAMEDHLDAYYELGGDIDASATSGWNAGEGFLPIGQVGSFTGQLNGKNYTISNLSINREDDYQALFGKISGSAVIQNVNMTAIDITGGWDYMGGLVGYINGNSSTISNCSTAGSIAGNYEVGGLVGYTEGGTISNSSSSCTVTATGYTAGGLIGWMDDGDVDQCYATGDVTGAGGGAGGFVGYAIGGTVDDCYARGDVTAGSEVGGFVGYNDSATINNSYSSGPVISGVPRLTITTDEGTFVATSDNRENFDGEGYLWAYPDVNYNTVHDSTGHFCTNYNQYAAVMQRYNIYNEGKYQISRAVIRFDLTDISGSMTSAVMSILAGSQVSHYTDWHFTLVDGSDCADPLVAGDYGDLLDETISLGSVAVSTIAESTRFEITLNDAGIAFLESKAGEIAVFGIRSSDDIAGIPPTGDFEQGQGTEMNFSTANGVQEGGFCGSNWGTITNSFWDTQTSWQSLSDGGTGLTTLEMFDDDVFLTAGWDGVDIWELGGGDYPRLSAGEPIPEPTSLLLLGVGLLGVGLFRRRN